MNLGLPLYVCLWLPAYVCGERGRGSESVRICALCLFCGEIFVDWFCKSSNLGFALWLAIGRSISLQRGREAAREKPERWRFLSQNGRKFTWALTYLPLYHLWRSKQPMRFSEAGTKGKGQSRRRNCLRFMGLWQVSSPCQGPMSNNYGDRWAISLSTSVAKQATHEIQWGRHERERAVTTTKLLAAHGLMASFHTMPVTSIT